MTDELKKLAVEKAYGIYDIEEHNTRLSQALLIAAQVIDLQQKALDEIDEIAYNYGYHSCANISIKALRQAKELLKGVK